MTEKAHKILDLIIDKKYTFALVFMCVSFSTFAFLYMTGLIPEELQVIRSDAEASESDDSELEAVLGAARESEGRENAALPAGLREELPTRVRIDRVGISTSVANPASTNVGVLDEALKTGVVRYPTSGKLGKDNMLLFGHSTSIRVVNNQAYKAFNNLKDVRIGDTVVVESGTRAYVYKVFSVRLTTTDEALVQFKPGRNMLTLSTCNTFGAKEERYVVEADFVESRPIGGVN